MRGPRDRGREMLLALRSAFGLFGILAGVEFPVDVMPAVEKSLAPVEASTLQRIGLGGTADGAVEIAFERVQDFAFAPKDGDEMSGQGDDVSGADFLRIVEPLAGLISPRMATKFSAPYVKEVVDAVQTADFPVIYHNCGNNTIKQAGSIFGIGAAGYHFGNAISMKEMLAIAPKDVWIMGNVDPAGELANGTPESVRAATLKLMGECCPDYPNFIVSSGCDIPPHAPWANLDAFFAAVAEYARERKA